MSPFVHGQLEVTMRSLPQFEQRPLSDYQEGEVLEVKVIRTSENAVFVDTGIDVRKLNSESPESYSEGQIVKVKIKTIETSSQTKITLSLA